MKIKKLLEKLNGFSEKLNEEIPKEITWKQVIKTVNMNDMEADMLAKDLGHSSFEELEAKSPPKVMYDKDPMAFANAFKNRVRTLNFIPPSQLFKTLEDILDNNVENLNIEGIGTESNESFKTILNKLKR